MNQYSTLKLLLLSTTLLIPIICMAVDPQQPKSTKEILHTIANKDRGDFYGEIKGIPEFDHKLHSDGCSGGMSEIYGKLKFLHLKYGETLPWRQCCVVHDRAYYNGGEKKEKTAADKELKNCVSEIVGPKHLGFVLGGLMEDVVWIGGLPYFPTTYRWGYGEDFRGTENLPVQ